MSQRGELVLDVWRHAVIRAALHEAVPLKSPQCLREHLAADSIDSRADLGEAQRGRLKDVESGPIREVWLYSADQPVEDEFWA